MRGGLLTMLAVLVAITIGVAVESTASAPALPAPVARAIASTMAVRSVEIRTSYPAAGGPAVYQAPDRWEGPVGRPTSSARGHTAVMRPVIIGDWEYQTLVGRGRHEGASTILLPPTPQHLSEPLGLPPAQQAAFLPLIDARLGHGYRHRGTTWTFQDHVGATGAIVTGGSITLAGGLVRRATINEDEGGRLLVLRTVYGHIDRAPLIPTPSKARPAG